MGGFLCKCFGKCFDRGEEEPPQTLYSATTDVTEPLVPVNEDLEDEPEEENYSFSANDQLLPESFPAWIITPKREPLNRNTLDNIPLLELQQELSNNLQLQPFITDYIKISTDTNQFLSSIEKYLKEVKSSADLLLQAVKLFETYREPASTAVETLKEFKAHGEIFPHIVDEFKSSCMHHVSRVQTLSELEKKMDQNFGKVETWKAVGSIVSCVTIFVLSISSMVLAFMGNAKVAEKVLEQGSKAIERLETEIRLLLDKRKSSLEGKRDNIGALLEQAKKELNNIKKLRKETLRAIKQLDIIKRRVHDQVEDCINKVEENIELHMGELKRMMTTVMNDIKTEAVCLDSCVEELDKEVVRCREDLNTVEATILKVVEKM